MKKSKGFLLLQSLLLFSACAVLLANALKDYGNCVRIARHDADLQHAWRLVQQAAHDESVSADRNMINIPIGAQLMEVRVHYGKSNCTVVVAQGQE